MSKHTVGYFSAYYRGLEILLKMWPEIVKEVPDAKLDIYYGWESWDAMSGDKDFKPRMLKLLGGLKREGVIEHGRISHTELAKAMKKTKVWAYPTEFMEIHCITALKAQEAGCIPVTTNVAALAETVHDKTYVVNSANIYSNEYAQKKFIKNMVAALKSDHKTLLVEGVDWSDVAKQWNEVVGGRQS